MGRIGKVERAAHGDMHEPLAASGPLVSLPDDPSAKLPCASHETILQLTCPADYDRPA